MILGTAQLGMDYGINNEVGKPDVNAAHTMLALAKESGIRLLDTAEGYGESEDIIGGYLSVNPGSFDVCTKLPVSLSSAGQRKVIEGAADSIRRLHVESLWCCYLHRFEQFLDEGIMLQLEAIKNKGLIEHVGVSIYNPEELQAIADSRWDIDIVQLPVNVLSSSLWQSTAEAAKKRGILLFARSVYLQGLVFSDPHSAQAKRIGASGYLQQLNELAEENNCGIASFCMGFVKSLDYIDDVLIGCETLLQLEENILLTASCPSFSHLDIEKVQREFKDVPQMVINPSLWPRR